MIKKTKKAGEKSKSNKSSKKIKGIDTMPCSIEKNIHIKKAANGYVVSTYSDKGERVAIAKTKGEVQKHIEDMLG